MSKTKWDSLVGTANLGRNKTFRRAAYKKNGYYLMKKVMRYKKKHSVDLVRERTIPTERPPPVGEVSANFCG